MSEAIFVTPARRFSRPGCLPTDGTSEELTTSVEPWRSSECKARYGGLVHRHDIVASSTMGEPIGRWPILTWQWAVPPRTSAA